ncbi:MAG TPA: sialate O-acetylesterase [Polyangiaceae bacterium]|nr:sialate O-acetylesterase [Polyangiaceae bacterium]
MKNSLIPSRQIVLPLTLLALACGVVEHPHERQALDTSDDFGPVGGSVATAGAAGAGVPLPPVGGSGGVAGTTAIGGTGGSGAPPLSGVTVTLGTTNVPKERAIAFIHLGHSNMAGVSSMPSASRPYHLEETNPRAYEYHAGTPPELALEPTARASGGRATAGPGVALLKEALAVAGADYYFISLGYGVNSAYCSQFLPGGLHYEDLMAGPIAIKDRVTFGAIFIYLGITERHGTEADRTGFPNCINSLVTAIRNEVGAPNLPLLLNDYEVESTGEFVVGGEVANAIMPQIAKVPMTVANSALVSCDDIPMQDDHHFDLDGQRMWAQRAIMTMQQKGWAVWQ